MGLIGFFNNLLKNISAKNSPSYEGVPDYKIIDNAPRYDARLLRGVTGEEGTFGTLYMGEVPLCVTVEPEWKNNEQNISCIPAGIYKVTKYHSPKYPDVWILKNVPNRSLILIHSGNTEDHTEGCIIVGSMFGNLGKKRAVLRSREALDKLRKALPNNFYLKIEDAT